MKNSIILILLAGLATVHCSSDESSSSTSSYTTKNLPSKFAVSTPKSLKSSSSTTSTKVSANITDESTVVDSYAYDELQNLLKQKDAKEKQIKIEFMLIDALIEKIKGQASPVFGAKDSQKITFTAEMKKAIEELEADLVASTEGAPGGAPGGDTSASSGVPAAGTEMPAPAFCYKTGLTENGYNFELKFAFDETTTAITDCNSTAFTTTYQWNEAKTLIRITDSFTETLPDGSKFSGNSVFNFDASKSLMTFKDTFKDSLGEFSQVVAMTPCSSDSAKIAIDCVKFEGKYGNKMTFNGQTQEFTFNMEGVADDNGGAVKSTMTMKMGATFQKDTYDEIFTSAGKVIARRANGGAWEGQDGSSISYFTEAASGVDTGQKKITVTWGADAPADSVAFQFVLVKSGGSASNPEDVIGEGSVYNSGGVTTEVFYFGPEDATVISSAKVFSVDGFDSAGAPTFTQKSNATVSQG